MIDMLKQVLPLVIAFVVAIITVGTFESLQQKFPKLKDSSVTLKRVAVSTSTTLITFLLVHFGFSEQEISTAVPQLSDQLVSLASAAFAEMYHAANQRKKVAEDVKALPDAVDIMARERKDEG
jgi:predicted PurR-regulated permease PerM